MINKRILFICPKFYNYHNIIYQQIELLNYDITFIEDLTEGTIRSLLYSRLPFYKNRLNKFFSNNILSLIQNNHFEKIFVIKGYLLTEELLKKLEEFLSFRSSEKILYQWDSNFRYNFENKIKYFDKIFSFDRYDSKNLNIEYLPLFYFDSIQTTTDQSYDLLFISSFTKERVETLQKLIRNPSFKKYNCFIFVYQPFFSYFKMVIYRNSFPLKYIHFKKLKQNKYIELLSKAKTVVDISHNNQSGLTMRSIEALGAKKKLITNNSCILLEPFYDSRYIKVFQDINDIFDDKFINTNHATENIYLKQLLLANWLKRILY